jgi:hypothetical protein
MKQTLLILIAAGVAFAQGGTTTVGQLFDGQLKMVESEVIPAVEAMPEAKFNFKPTNGAFGNVRTFAEQAKHLAAVTYICAAAAKKEKPPVDTGGEAGPASAKTKAQVVQFVKDSFAYAHTAAASISEDNALEMVKSPFGGPDMARAAIMSCPIWHSFDHYGQMAVYLRLNNVVPPASRGGQ